MLLKRLLSTLKELSFLGILQKFQLLWEKIFLKPKEAYLFFLKKTAGPSFYYLHKFCPLIPYNFFLCVCHINSTTDEIFKHKILHSFRIKIFDTLELKHFFELKKGGSRLVTYNLECFIFWRFISNGNNCTLDCLPHMKWIIVVVGCESTLLLL